MMMFFIVRFLIACSFFYVFVTEFFFFFKQKTAYEMRISDWSSDVCSSDDHSAARTTDRSLPRPARRRPEDRAAHGLPRARTRARWRPAAGRRAGRVDRTHRPLRALPRLQRNRDLRHLRQRLARRARSEEHQSELQSLMRTSYAVI